MNLRKPSMVGVATLLVSLLVSSSSAIANTTQGVTSNTILFGATYPLTGPLSPGISSYYFGINAYFEHVNANGGINGRKLVFLGQDASGPTQAISRTQDLLYALESFALISNAPSCASQVATSRSVGIARLGVPNVFVDCYLETTEDSKDQYATNFYSKISGKNEAAIIKAYVDETYPNQRIALAYQDDDNGLFLSKFALDSRVVCKKAFVAGSENMLGGCNSNLYPLQDGDIVIYSGNPSGLSRLIMNYSITQKLNLRYFVNYDAYNPKALQLSGLPATANTEIFTLSHNSLLSETKNTAVSTLSAIGQKYSLGATIDQRFLNGLNAGYVISNVIAALGSEVDRDRFMKGMALFGAQFDVLGVSEKSQDPTQRFMPIGGVIVRNVGSNNVAISDVLSIDKGQLSTKPRRAVQVSVNALPTTGQLLPNSTPTTSAAPTATPTPTPTASPTPTPASKPTPAPSATADPILEVDGEEEEPFGKVAIKKDKNKYTISISSNLPNETLQVRATKKGAKSIVFKVTTNDDGYVKFTTTRVLAGFQVALLLDGEILTSVKAG